MNNLSFRPAPASAGGAFPVEVELADTNANKRSLIADYLSIANRRKWLILGTTVGFVLAGLLITLFMTPLYTASATIEIQRETSNVAEVKGEERTQSSVDAEFYETQYGLLRSRALAERVARTLRLGDDPAFFETFGVTASDEWFQNGRAVQTPAVREERLKTAGGLLLKNIKIEPERLSRLVEVSFTSPDPQLSKRVVDGWSENFVQTTLERRYAATSYARKFLEDRLQQLRVRIDQSERALVGYAANQNIVNIPGNSGTQGESTGERSLVADDLVNLNRELATATADRVQAESRLAGNSNVKEALDNSTTNTLRARRAELNADYARMLQQFAPDYPPAKALRAQIASIDAALRGETGRVTDVLRQNYDAAVTRENALAAQVKQLTGRVLDFRRRSIQYNILQREVDTNRQLYDALLQRYKEIGVAGGVGVNNISVVDEAEVPGAPSSPRLFFNLALALLAGLVAGCGIALLLEQIDEGITDPIDVEPLLGMPLIGVTPQLSNIEPLDALQDSKSALTEAYASIAANLGFATSHGVPRSLAVTSARPAEGKSSTSYALARSLARINRRVLLLDADMRSPSVHHLLHQPLGNGLSNYLAGDDDLGTLVRATEIDRLSIMTAGPQPPSTPELLAGNRLTILLEQLATEFDHVVLDLPPVMGLADAPLIASKVEGTLIVTAAHSTHKNVARLAVGRLRSAHAHLLGAVLSMFDSRQASYGYGYGYGYGEGYGYGDKAK
ncbi:capsular exopolysaccharide family [Sphingomonas palmae]|uniref:Capsular exopolysaccharide family n=1 Tax=Sphingomonas palmae TaxID=1855283 RepID=A0A1H7UZJ8_9SPHN|nr:capsular exopolysaccharide family [Sphingomonas palmae]